MNTVEQLMDRNRETHEIDGMAFVCHRWSMALAVEAFGAGAFAIVQDGDRTKVEVDAKAVGDRNELITKALKVAMIEPHLADEDDAEAGAVSLRTLGDVKYKLFDAVMGGTAAKAKGFPESSKGQKA